MLIRIRELGDRPDVPVWSPSRQDLVSVPAWMGGLTFRRACEEEDTAWDMAEALWTRLREHPGHATCLAAGSALYDRIRGRLRDSSVSLGLPPLVWRQSPVEDFDLTVGAGNHLRMAVDTVMHRFHPVFGGNKIGRVMPDRELQSAVEPDSAALKEAALNCLRAADEPLDEWRQAVVIAHLLAPELALFAVSQLFWHPPPPPGQTDKERQHATAIGSPDKTERAGVQAKRDFQRRAGFQGHGRKRGPKPGAVRHRSQERVQFEEYVLRRLALGVKSIAVASDAEARRLYRLNKNDPLAKLTEGIVRGVHRRNL